MPGPVFREGELVELRTIEEADVDFLQETINEPRIRRDTFAVEPINGPAELEWIRSLSEGDGAHFLVCDDGDPVGVISLKSPDQSWGRAEVGYSITPEQWGNGYATDALDQVCGYAFEERRLHKVYASTYATNPASIRVLEKVGFTREGEFRDEGFVEGEHVDVYRYGLLADEWLDT